jgi:hypothetical protein
VAGGAQGKSPSYLGSSFLVSSLLCENF